jgi:hypothetical protein
VSPFPALCWIALVAFLSVLALLAMGVTRLAAPRELGGHPRGFLGGLAALVAVVFLGGLGFVGLGASMVAMGDGSVVDWNPVRRVEVHRDPAEVSSSGAKDGDVVARVTVREGAAADLVDFLHDVVGLDLDDIGQALAVQERVDENGQGFEVYEFRLPVDERDLAHLERDLERELDGLDVQLPQGLAIDLGPRR